MASSISCPVSKTSFASGAFRDAFEAQGISGIKGRCVVKRYKPDKVKAIEEVFGSVDNHTRKSVQMHTLAKYFNEKIEKARPGLYIMNECKRSLTK